MLVKHNCNVSRPSLTINVMPDTHWQRFGKWLRTQRRQADLTQAQVARRAGIHELQVGRIEKGESGTKRETVIALANAIGIDLELALNQAGYAAVKPDEILFSRASINGKPKKPQTFAEFIEALEKLGIALPGWVTTANLEEYTDEQLEELKQKIAEDTEFAIWRKEK